MWKVRVANTHLKFVSWKRKAKDKYLGKAEVIVIEVTDPWEQMTLSHYDKRFRGIIYRLKRRNLPWYSTRAVKGIQIEDEDNPPVPYQDPYELARVLNEVNISLIGLSERNKQRNAFFDKTNAYKGNENANG
jgi:hypothetical protein